MGSNICEVIDAAVDGSPYGFMRFEPGPGMGGHCLPSTRSTCLAARVNSTSRPSRRARRQINQQMPYHCVEKVQRVLTRAASVRGSRIAMLGVAYKPGVADTRESAAIKLIGLLQGLGAESVYHDEHVPDASGCARYRCRRPSRGRRSRSSSRLTPASTTTPWAIASDAFLIFAV